jgi:hypothetical protein
VKALTDDDMAKVAELLRKQLHRATPEQYRIRREFVHDLYLDFTLWFAETDPDFLPVRFYALVFEDYPAELYG